MAGLLRANVSLHEAMQRSFSLNSRSLEDAAEHRFLRRGGSKPHHPAVDARPLMTVRSGPSKSGQAQKSARVELSELSGFSTGAESIVLSAKRKGDASTPKKGHAQSPVAFSAFSASQLDAAKDLLQSVKKSAQSIGAPSLPKGKQGSAMPTWMLPAAGGLVLVAGIGLFLRRSSQGENTVDALARRGFISSDRTVPLELIQDFDDPTKVRDYKLGNAKLVELEPLSPLTEEKMRYHREQRRKEHGWKKPEHVLVEGEPMPEGVDPMTVRYIPKKHPFALNSEEVDEQWSEDVARRRLRQRRGRPEKEQQRSKMQLERLKREMELREAAMGTDDGTSQDGRLGKKSGVLPSIDD